MLDIVSKHCLHLHQYFSKIEQITLQGIHYHEDLEETV